MLNLDNDQEEEFQSGEFSAVNDISEFYTQTIDYLANPKNEIKDSYVIYQGFVADNNLYKMCLKHDGLFEQLKLDLQHLRIDRYCLDDVKVTDLERAVLEKLSQKFAIELETLIDRQKLLHECAVFAESFAATSPEAEELRNGIPLQQGLFLVQATNQFYSEFHVKMFKLFSQQKKKWKVKVSMQENLLEIEQKVMWHLEKHGGMAGWQYVTDMIRATVTVDSVDDIWAAYTCIKNSGWFIVIGLQDRLAAPSKELLVTIDFMGCMIGEIRLTYAALPP